MSRLLFSLYCITDTNTCNAPKYTKFTANTNEKCVRDKRFLRNRGFARRQDFPLAVAASISGKHLSAIIAVGQIGKSEKQKTGFGRILLLYFLVDFCTEFVANNKRNTIHEYTKLNIKQNSWLLLSSTESRTILFGCLVRCCRQLIDIASLDSN